AQIPAEALAGVTVTLNGPGIPAAGITTKTDSNGHYMFTGLAPGSGYTVTVPSPVADCHVVSHNPCDATVVSDQTARCDFEYKPNPGNIEGTLFCDLNGDHTAQTPPFPYTTLSRSLNGPGIPAAGITTKTDSNGHYLFTGLAP